MKRLVLLLMLAVVATGHSQWWTAMSESTGLVLCLQWTDGTPRLYSPLQSQEPLPISKWIQQVDTLKITCKSIGFSATMVKQDSNYSCTWKQGLMRENILFRPGDTIFLLNRPQTPRPPFPYSEEIVATDFTDSQGNEVHLEGTLTLPEGDGRVPCLVLVSGSGQQNRDEELMQHRPFAVLADYMARRGIATLRYDDRGVGASKGSLEKGDTYLFAEDAEAMWEAVRSHPRVDTAMLGIGGHSEGGAIAPMVAARRTEVSFVVMLAGQGCTGREVLVQQNEALYRAKGVSERLCKVRGRCMDTVFGMPEGSSAKEIQQAIIPFVEALQPAEADSIDLKKGMAYALKMQLDARWMRSFIGLAPAAYLPSVQCPILAVNGEKDCQVLAEPNLSAIRKLTNGKARCIQLANLNHLFQVCTTGSPSEYIFIEQTFAPEAMRVVVDFINDLQKERN